MTALSVSDLDLADPRLHEAVELLIAHQRAVSAGDEDRADALLADLERPLRRLNWAQNEWLRGLSGDLQMLSDEEVREPNTRLPGEYQSAVQSAWANVEDDPEALLALLRKEQTFLSEDKVAIGRAKAYDVLGFPRVFWAFADYAVQLAPENLIYKSFMLDQLRAEGRRPEVLKLGRLLLTEPSSPPIVVLGAASALDDNADFLPEEQARVLLGRVRRTVETVIRGGQTQALDVETMALGMLTLASVSGKLRRKAEAQKWYQRAIDLTPNDDIPYVGMGLFLYREDRPKALYYFTEAVKRATPVDFPYFALAQSALLEGRYEECRRLAGRSLELADGSPQFKAKALGLIGLALLRQAGPTDEVLRLLREAVECDPADESLRRNLDVVEEARRSQDASDAAQRQRPSYAALGDAPVVPDNILNLTRLADIPKRTSQQVNKQLAMAA